MNQSNSPGFLYYDTSAESQFIELNSSRGTGAGRAGAFSPRNYSSPEQSWNGSRGRGHNNRRGRPPSFSGQGRYSGTGNSSYHSFSGSNNKSYDNNRDLSSYVNPSMVADPWAELEAALHSSLKTHSNDDKDA